LEVIDFGNELFPTAFPLGDSTRPHELKRSARAIGQTDLRRVRQEFEIFGFWAAKQYRWNPEVMDGYALVIEGRSGNHYRTVTRVNIWDGAEQIACPLFDIARIMLPDRIRCVRPVTVP
jgi:hypothetical protein